MTKSIDSGLVTHYAGSALTLARLWKITRTDGDVYAFTDHDTELTYSGTTYQPTSAFSGSAIATKAAMNVDDLEVVGLIDSAGITEADIEAGLWDGAAVELRQVNWANLADGAEVLRVGEIGNINRRGGGFVAELRGLMQKLQNNIGSVVQPLCNAELGDARCGKDLTTFTHATTVSSASSRRVFVVGITQADAYFAAGKAAFTSGANSGIVADIKSNIGSSITLQLPLPYDLAATDGVTLVAGCDKRHLVSSAGVVTGDCNTKFSNVVNFRGFWAVPGRDKTLIVGGQG